MVKDGKDEDKVDANADDVLHFIEGEPEHLPGHNCPLSKGGSPEVGGITVKYLHQSWMYSFFYFDAFSSSFSHCSPFGYPKTIPSKHPLGKHSLELTQHMTEISNVNNFFNTNIIL